MSDLPPRMTEVVRLRAEGLLTKEIAHKLGITVKTAENHISAAHRKLGIHNTAQLTRYAIRVGLVYKEETNETDTARTVRH